MGQLISQVHQLEPADIQLPALMIVSSRDRIIDTRAASEFFSRFNHPQNRLFYFNASQDPDHHILGGDIVSPTGNGIILNESINFLNGISL